MRFCRSAEAGERSDSELASGRSVPSSVGASTDHGRGFGLGMIRRMNGETGRVRIGLQTLARAS